MDNISTYPKDWYKQLTRKKKPRSKHQGKVSDDKSSSDEGSRKSSKDEGKPPKIDKATETGHVEEKLVEEPET